MGEQIHAGLRGAQRQGKIKARKYKSKTSTATNGNTFSLCTYWGPAPVTLGLERFCCAGQTAHTPVKMLAARTAESGRAPRHYSHRTQQMNHNSRMFPKRTCSLAAASPLPLQADGYTGNHGGRATAAALKQRAASPAEGGQRQRSAHPLQQAPRQRQRPAQLRGMLASTDH